MCLMVGLLLTMVLCADSPRKAAEHMKLGQYEDAMRVYADLASRKPDDSRYFYNAGVAAYKAQRFQEAQEYFDASSLSSDLGLQQQSFYNRGNALYKAGENEAEFEQKTQLWKEALDQFDHAVKLNDTDKLATENLQFVKTQLENLQEQQQEQNQENQPNEDQDEDDKQDDQNKQDKQQQDNQNDQDKQQQDNQNDQNDQQQDNREDSNEGNNQNQPSEEGQEDLKKGDQDDKNPEKPEEQEQKQSPKSDENQDGEEGSAGQPEEGEGNETAPTTMTPQQAMQLLESAKDEAKALIFKPQANKRNRRFKDW